MNTIAIDNNNDIYLTPSGNIALKEDIEALADILTNKAQTAKNELQYDVKKGINFLDTIFASPSEPELFQSELIEQLEDTEQVQRVFSYTSEIKDGVYSYTADIITDYGVLTLNG